MFLKNVIYKNQLSSFLYPTRVFDIQTDSFSSSSALQPKCLNIGLVMLCSGGREGSTEAKCKSVVFADFQSQSCHSSLKQCCKLLVNVVISENRIQTKCCIFALIAADWLLPCQFVIIMKYKYNTVTNKFVKFSEKSRHFRDWIAL